MRIVAAFIAVILLGSAPIGDARRRSGGWWLRASLFRTWSRCSRASGEQRFRVNLLIDNPNTEPLAIRNIEFKLRLADEGIIDGFLPAPIMVEALDQQTVTLELGSEIISSLSRLMSFVRGSREPAAVRDLRHRHAGSHSQGPVAGSALRGEVPLVLAEPALTA